MYCLGCFGTTKQQLSANGTVQMLKMDGHLTTSKCAAKCASRGALFVGLHFGVECWCGFSLDRRDQNPNMCRTRCSGVQDPVEICGGYHYMSTYALKPSLETVAPYQLPVILDKQLRDTTKQFLEGGARARSYASAYAFFFEPLAASKALKLLEVGSSSTPASKRYWQNVFPLGEILQEASSAKGCDIVIVAEAAELP